MINELANIDFSVLLPVYYKEKAENLDASIKSVINQTQKTNDLVIVCDGKLTKELYAVINSYKQQYNEILNVVQLPNNLGLGKALNYGLLECKNELVARMDSDDICYSNRFELQLNCFINHNVDIVGGVVDEFVDNPNNIVSQRVSPSLDEEIKKYAKRRNPFNHPAIMYKKSSVLKVDGYQEFPYFEDYYLWIRMFMSGAKGYNLVTPLIYMRVGNDLYARRGGFKYAFTIIRFRWFLLIKGYSGIIDFIVSTTGHVAVSLMPNAIRKKIYEKALRK